ncbi:unnamed protein product, partial [Polarella glacialis]
MSGRSSHSQAEEALRAVHFDLLRQLQSAVRTIILTSTVGNSCVRCSDGLCTQLFRIVRSCLLAGCRRFSGSDPSIDDLLFLLVVPEFIGAFSHDLDFVAYLFIGRAAATFARQLFADELRVAHFYQECAIMFDEELHLAFVSSLLALENVNFHPDSPLLAQMCLSASLEDLSFSVVPWSRKTADPRASRKNDHTAAAKPDQVLPKSDFGARVSKGTTDNIFAAFWAGKEEREEQVGALAEGKEQREEQVGVSGDLEQASGGGLDKSQQVDESLPRTAETAASEGDQALLAEEEAACEERREEGDEEADEDEEADAIVDDISLKASKLSKDLFQLTEFKPQEMYKMTEFNQKALLRKALSSCTSVLVLEDAADQEVEASAEALQDGGVGETLPEAVLATSWHGRALGGSAVDLGAGIQDAFGLD